MHISNETTMLIRQFWREVQKVRKVEMLLLSDQDDERVYSIAREAAHVSGKD